MRRQLEDFREFLTLVGKRVVAWITGGLITAALFIYEHLQRNISSTALYWGVLGYITLASYLAWRCERQARVSVEQNAERSALLAKQHQNSQREQRCLSVYWSFEVAERLRRAPLPDIEHPFDLSTADPTGKRFAEISILIRNGVKRANPIGPQPHDLDSFKLPVATARGIVIYGNNSFANALAETLGQFAYVFRSNEHVGELNAYYEKFGKTDVIGIAIGPGVPWKDDYLD